ncbi:MAG: bifunctional phosphopantothenoylcysteine decarboxylase/phosphopantothenate--cysteine ligase CoaBC [Bacteroidetes bacterium]|nr:MAG: bifunctional phosphopantothenoylcysteine decarboxylase/phosphopantothenate--cysteine ligase CoaBC [Bacteroidota bacterium]
MKDKKIIIGVTGSIAAYKIAFLVRLLVKEGAQVQIIMSESAQDFISPLTLATLSKKPVLADFQKDTQTGEWNNHVELGLWADAILIAPATANTLAKMANGLCDSLLLATYLSARCPVFVAPAMDLDMFLHPSTQRNLQILGQFQHQIIEPESGELASGLFGKGRMAEPEHILAFLANYFSEKNNFFEIFSNKKVLITAGATRENIDPVRFISNHSSGKMGYALAEVFADSGAFVTLISGISNLKIQHKNISKIEIKTAQEMYEKTLENFAKQDIIIHAAAVADYTPKVMAETKIKKKGQEMTLELIKTKDIAAEVGRLIGKNQIHVGFALETDHEIENAKGKLISKNFDLIVLNSMQVAGAGFDHETNQVLIIDDKNVRNFPLKSKKEVAKDILQAVLEKWKEKDDKNHFLS